MMKKVINWVLAAILICGVTSVKAQDFYDFSAVSSSGDTLYYYIDEGVAVVTCPGDDYESDYWPEGITQPQGALVIDGTVTYNDTTYTVACIDSYTFYGCSGITSVTIPESVTDFGIYVFTGTALAEPVYKDSVFVYMPATATGVYTIPDHITKICGGAFYQCAGLTHVVLPNSVTEIGPGAFLECEGLTQPIYNNMLFARLPLTYSGSYTIPDGITTVCASSFTYTSGLTELVMPNSVTSMGAGSIGNCTSLTSVTLSDALTEIPGFAFMGCTALATITLPAGIDSIGPGAFFKCAAMDSIVVKSTTPPSVGMSAFRNVPDSCLLVVPCGTLEAYTEAWGTYFERIVEDCGSGTGIDGLAPTDASAESPADVYDLSGRRVASLQTAGKIPALPNGIYVVRIGKQPARKVVVKR